MRRGRREDKEKMAGRYKRYNFDRQIMQIEKLTCHPYEYNQSKKRRKEYSNYCNS